MKISIVTLFPKMISAFLEESIIKRAQEKKKVEIELINLRDFAVDERGTVDGRPYGGGAGMVLRIEPLYEAISKIKSEKLKIKSKIVLTSARGKSFNQQKAGEYAKLDHLILIAGHYEGVDERIYEHIDEEVSVGDFVLTGGEIATAAITDSVVRLLEGVLKKEDATANESFFEFGVEELITIIGKHKRLIELQEKGTERIQLLEYPHYTRPDGFKNKKVPDVLKSGNEKKINEWRIKKAFQETLKKRPDLLTQR